MSYEKDGIKQIEVEELKELLKSNGEDKVFIDVREPEEYEAAHIPGVPLLPMNNIPFFLEGFKKDKEYVFICRSGNRSQNVSRYLKENGIEKVVNFDGGMLSWDGEKAAGPEHQIKDVNELKEWNK
ncbi:rhodanese-related sulfurtransferase [Evansella vedderi]|uniref:Rhodanese-related sulfurtransferase n=1 Tax=Evansella vedderi TaxID=38282 RepID=A0ABU0A3D3_9BACI|nr:rhodanese-like domain-containing protein [Evansella vedderi]MDQ0258001.1 rhodanese-related sulfurtransferase [Evansella vedderi]